MEKYNIIGDIGSGNFGVAKLVWDKCNKKYYAAKFIQRGKKIDEHVQREIMNHRSLKHHNIICFKEVVLTPTHLAIIMEYAAGGELFTRIHNAGGISEDEARYFFQQMVSGVSYCHSMKICHRDLKLENTLLDGSAAAPLLKICDFGYSKSAALHSRPNSKVGTPAYVAPEIFSGEDYDGNIADVWSLGVALYVMLVGAYPFEDPADHRNFAKTLSRIVSVQYSIPDHVTISMECRVLLSRIFVVDPGKRITMAEIENDPWFLKNKPRELMEKDDLQKPSQSMEEALGLIQEARNTQEDRGGSMKFDNLDTDFDFDLDDDDDIEIRDVLFCL